MQEVKCIYSNQFLQDEYSFSSPKVNSNLPVLIDPDSLHPECHWWDLCGCLALELCSSTAQSWILPSHPALGASFPYVFEAGWVSCKMATMLSALNAHHLWHPRAVTGFGGCQQQSFLRCIIRIAECRQPNPHKDEKQTPFPQCKQTDVSKMLWCRMRWEAQGPFS